MRKRIFGKRLKRDTNERKALFRSLMHGLVLHGKITTSKAKSQAIRADIEKLVTIAKNKGEEARNILIQRLANEKVSEKIIKEIAPLFASRPGGYTRTLKLGQRVKDGSQMVLMTWVKSVSVSSQVEPKRKTQPQQTKPQSPKTQPKIASKEKKAAAKKPTKK